jgi:hypothetical protein
MTKKCMVISALSPIGIFATQLAVVGSSFELKCTSSPLKIGPKKAITKMLINADHIIPKAIIHKDLFKGSFLLARMEKSIFSVPITDFKLEGND